MTATPPANARDLQRLRYWQGQMLRSRDFRDQLAIEGQLRYWHNRAMHNAFGIASGFEASIEEKSVKIEPGIAFDGFGEEILLQRERSLRVPPSDEPVTLLARHSYKDCRSYPRKAEVGTPFFAPKNHLFAEEPEFLWKPSASVELRDGVPLAGVVLAQGKLTLDSKFTKPVARSIARPKVAGAKTILGATRWEAWTIPAGEHGGAYGFQVTIDASAVGFTETPCYFAWLQGPIWNEEDPDRQDMPDGPTAGAGAGVGTQQASNVGGVHWDHIDRVSRKGFVFRFVMYTFPNQLTDPPPVDRPTVTSLLRKRYFVSWMGIQPDPEEDAEPKVTR